jgi:hypothetical protein
MLACENGPPNHETKSNSESPRGATTGSGSGAQAESGRPDPIVQLEPLDLTTSVGSSPLHILVANAGDPVGAELLQRIADTVKIKTWPELDDVSATVSEITDTTGNSGEDEYAHIYLAPSSQLSDRWYALYVEKLPQGVAWPVYSSTLTLADGSHVSRFRIGSEPVVASVRVLQGAQKRAVYVDFSERISGDSSLVGLSYARNGVATSCKAQSMTPAAVSTATDGSSGVSTNTKPSDVSAKDIRLSCSDAVDSGQPIQLTIRPGLRSASGPSVGGGRMLQFRIDPSEWRDWGNGTKLYRPTSP